MDMDRVRAGFRSRLATQRPVFFLDYDGTLTPIVSTPDQAYLDPRMREVLRALSGRCPVAIISGRDLDDVKKRVRLRSLYYAGSHGFDIEGPDGFRMAHPDSKRFQPAMDDAARRLGAAIGDVGKIIIERKRFAIAVHYRNVSDDQIGRVESAVKDAVARVRALRCRRGKRVMEIVPDIEWHKGAAVTWLMQKFAARMSGTSLFPVFIGDDVTDEDAFCAIQKSGIGIRIGTDSVKTHAHFRLPDVDAVLAFLRFCDQAIARCGGSDGT